MGNIDITKPLRMRNGTKIVCATYVHLSASATPSLISVSFYDAEKDGGVSFWLYTLDGRLHQNKGPSPYDLEGKLPQNESLGFYDLEYDLPTESEKKTARCDSPVIIDFKIDPDTHGGASRILALSNEGRLYYLDGCNPELTWTPYPPLPLEN